MCQGLDLREICATGVPKPVRLGFVLLSDEHALVVGDGRCTTADDSRPAR